MHSFAAPDHLRGDALNNRIRRDILRYHRTRGYHCAVIDGHTWQNDRQTADEDIIADLDHPSALALVTDRDGTVAMFLISAFIAFWRLGLYGVVVAALASLVERIPRIDDNITIPIVTAICVYLKTLF